MDHLRALEAFSAVARQGSFVGAARKLGLSPPSVTRIIGELEDHLGAALLHRSTRALHLTETGTAYLRDAERILEELRAADDLAQKTGLRPRGLLRLTSSVLFGQMHVAPIIADYVSHYPDVRVDADFSDRNVNLIEEGFDVAIRIGELQVSNLRAIRVGTVRHIVCGSPEYLKRHGTPSHPDDLRDHQIIEFRGAAFLDQTWRFDDGISVRIEPRMTFSTISPCLAMARAGHGLTRVLSYQTGSDTDEGVLETVLDNFSGQEWPVHLVHAAPHGQSAKLRAFLDLATERLRSNNALNAG